MQPLTIVTLVIVVIAVVVFLFRAVIYDAIISGMTAAWCVQSSFPNYVHLPTI